MKPNTVVVGWPNNWRKREDDGTKVLIPPPPPSTFPLPPPLHLLPHQVFVNTIRAAGAGKMALLVPKGIQRFPDSGDTVKVCQTICQPNQQPAGHAASTCQYT